MTRKESRRMLGIPRARLREARLDEVKDPRQARGKRWMLGLLLKICLVGLTCRCRSLAHVESLTEEMGPGLRHMLGLGRRVSDTTLRDVVVRLEPLELRGCLHHQTRAARRRKALEPNGLPFGVVAIDGKNVTLDAWDDTYAQFHRDANGLGAKGLLRTFTCALVSSSSKMCIDAIPIPAKTNEMGHFAQALDELCQAYGKGLFELCSMDAGMCSLANADHVRDHGRHYLFALKNDQPTLLAEVLRLLAHKIKPQAETVDYKGHKEIRRSLYLTEDMAGFSSWRHLRTVFRVKSEEIDLRTGEVKTESRYFICSLDAAKLTPAQWLLLVRRHWGVENECHWTWDAVFEEDKHPWIKNDPKGALVVLLLRRMAFNMMALFRSVTQRSPERRQTPWKDILRKMYNAAICGQIDEVRLLRERASAPA